MKYILLFLVAALGVTSCSCINFRKSTSAAKLAAAAKGHITDNNRCHVCHINYAEETLAVSHIKQGVGCETCHGTSDPHCGDENNMTPPDVMYALDKVVPLCTTCHKPIETDPIHKKKVVTAVVERKVCTDCHGEHRLAVRTRHWDKAGTTTATAERPRLATD